MKKAMKFFRLVASNIMFLIGRVVYVVGLSILDAGLWLKTRACYIQMERNNYKDDDPDYNVPPQVVRGGCEVQTGVFRRADCYEEENKEGEQI